MSERAPDTTEREAVTTLTQTSTAIDRQQFVPPGCDMTVDPLTVPLLTRVELAPRFATHTTSSRPACCPSVGR